MREEFKEFFFTITFDARNYSWFNIKKTSLVSVIFPIISIYNFNKINAGNPQITLYQPI